jgi:hypothetical protein
MSGARIARGSTNSTRRPAKGRSGGSKPRGKAKQPGLFEGLPISPRTARKLGMLSFVGAVTIIVAASAIAFRVPQRIGDTVGEQVGAAGFAVSRVELRGLNRMQPSTVTKAALGPADARHAADRSRRDPRPLDGIQMGEGGARSPPPAGYVGGGDRGARARRRVAAQSPAAAGRP